MQVGKVEKRKFHKGIDAESGDERTSHSADNLSVKWPIMLADIRHESHRPYHQKNYVFQKTLKMSHMHHFSEAPAIHIGIEDEKQERKHRKKRKQGQSHVSHHPNPDATDEANTHKAL